MKIKVFALLLYLSALQTRIFFMEAKTMNLDQTASIDCSRAVWSESSKLSLM